MEPTQPFRSLEIRTWRQIDLVKFNFDDRLTILTGANGTGKTTILNLISRHFGWSIPLVATPIRDKRSGLLRYVTDFWKAYIWIKGRGSSVAAYYRRNHLW
jgi:hypothetical protein